MNLQVLDSHALDTHAAGHAEALNDLAWRRAAADGAWRAVLAVHTVGSTQTTETVTLHDASGALALAGAGDVDEIGLGEHVSSDLLAQGVFGGVGGAQLDEVTSRGHTSLLEVASLRLGDVLRLDGPVAKLDGGVAISLGRAHLSDDTRSGLDDGHGNEPIVLVPQLGHAELGAQHALDSAFIGHGAQPHGSLISMSTPAGRSRRISESTVFGVGSRMSMSRLWVRISKCSRLSLYLWGERITQNTFFSVGSGTGPATLAPVRVTVSTILRADESMTSWS